MCAPTRRVVISTLPRRRTRDARDDAHARRRSSRSRSGKTSASRRARACVRTRSTLHFAAARDLRAERIVDVHDREAGPSFVKSSIFAAA